MEQNGTKLKVLPLLITPEQPPTPPTPSPANILQRGQNEVEVKLLLSSRTSDGKQNEAALARFSTSRQE